MAVLSLIYAAVKLMALLMANVLLRSYERKINMSEECAHDCSSCSAECGERDRESFIEALNEFSSVKKVIAVMSGKGGVGKSLVTSLMACAAQRRGYKTAILDADITGPSIPNAFGITQKAEAIETGLLPVKSKTGIDIMSLNLLLEDATDPVVWRGPVIAGTVKQFWTDVIWESEDYMFVDMPPGTGDVPLTVFQSLPIDGIIVVTSPQELVSMIVEKAVKMAGIMEVPVVGIVENMSYFICGSCNKKHEIFGHSNIEDIASKYGIKSISKLPMDPQLAKVCDNGSVELIDGQWLDGLMDRIEKS